MPDLMNTELILKLFDQLKESYDKMSNQLEDLSKYILKFISSESMLTKQDIKNEILSSRKESFDRLKDIEQISKEIKKHVDMIIKTLGISEETIFKHIDGIGKFQDVNDKIETVNMEINKLISFMEILQKSDYNQSDMEQIGGFINKINDVHSFITIIKSRVGFVIGAIALFAATFGCISFIKYIILLFTI